MTIKANRTLCFILETYALKVKAYERQSIIRLLDPKSSMPPVWSPYTQANINKVEKVQRRAARWVFNDYSSYSSVTQMLNTLGWRSLEQGRADTRPAYIRHPVRMTRTMCSMHYIQIPTTANYYKYSFFPLVTVQWNKLPAQVVMSLDLNSFRSTVCSLHHSMP